MTESGCLAIIDKLIEIFQIRFVQYDKNLQSTQKNVQINSYVL